MMILHHVPQTVKNNASKAEAPVRGIHSIVNLARHHYTGSGSWVSTLLIAAIAAMLTVAAILACRVSLRRGGQAFVGSNAPMAGLVWQGSQAPARPHWSTRRAALPGFSPIWPALPGATRRDRVLG